MTFIFRNRTIFWDISKWNRGKTKWDGGSNVLACKLCLRMKTFNNGDNKIVLLN